LMNLRMGMKKLWITGIVSAALVGIVLTVLVTQFASAALINNQQAVAQLSNWQGNTHLGRTPLRHYQDLNNSALMERLRMRQCLENATIKVEETSITGKFTDAEQGIIVLSVDGSSMVIRAPGRWVINGEVKSFIHLFVDDVVVKGHDVKVDALKITVTLRDGTSTTHYIAKTITDLSSGVTAQAVMPTISSGSPNSFPGQAA